MVETSSVKEANIQNQVNPLFEMKWKDKIESQFLHGTKTIADLPHECQVEEYNFWLKNKTESSLKAISETIKLVRKCLGRHLNSMRIMIKTLTNLILCAKMIGKKIKFMEIIRQPQEKGKCQNTQYLRMK